MNHTRIIPQEGSFALDDRIFLGEGLFETIKIQKAMPCFAFLHWQRLKDSAHKLGIPFDVSLEDWNRMLVETIRNDNLFDGGIKVILSGGLAPRGLAEQGQNSHLAFQTFNVSMSDKPTRLVTVPWRRDSRNPIYQVKSTNYLEAIQARRYALSCHAEDALFLNTHNHVTETTCANFFIILDGVVFTAPLSEGVLPGVTRSRIASLCDVLNIPYQEQALPYEVALEAQAGFVTNALQGIVCIASIDACVMTADHEIIKTLSAFIFQDVFDDSNEQ